MTVAALLVATLYAPLFHVHMHAGEAPLVHAHLPELASTEDEKVLHIEPSHSHSDVRSFDFLTTTVSPTIHLDVAIVPSVPVIDATPHSHGYLPAFTAVAHSPPASKFQTSRAPPAQTSC